MFKEKLNKLKEKNVFIPLVIFSWILLGAIEGMLGDISKGVVYFLLAISITLLTILIELQTDKNRDDK